MPKLPLKFTLKEKDLIRRYLVWCYKTTKENLDRIDRYYTQQVVDHFMLNELTQTREFRSDKTPIEYKRLIKSFEDYAENKVKNADRQKFAGEEKKTLSPNYLYLRNRFAAIEKAISYFLGKKELDKICSLYEAEMTQRILLAKEHS